MVLAQQARHEVPGGQGRVPGGPPGQGQGPAGRRPGGDCAEGRDARGVYPGRGPDQPGHQGRNHLPAVQFITRGEYSEVYSDQCFRSA